MSRKPCRQCGNDGDHKPIVNVRTVNFATIINGDRWTKKEMLEATERDPELSLFAKWLEEGRLPIDSDELTRHDPVTNSLHAQWERFR